MKKRQRLSPLFCALGLAAAVFACSPQAPLREDHEDFTAALRARELSAAVALASCVPGTPQVPAVDRAFCCAADAIRTLGLLSSGGAKEDAL